MWFDTGPRRSYRAVVMGVVQGHVAEQGIGQVLLHALWHGVEVTFLVLLMMLVVDYLNLLSRGKASAALGSKPLRQVVVSALLGAVPGCLGSFLVVTMFMRGMVGIGAVVACFLVSAGDAAFVMLSVIPRTAAVVVAASVPLAIVAGFVVEKVFGRMGISRCEICNDAQSHATEPECRAWPDGGLGSNFSRPSVLRLAAISVVGAAAVVVFFTGFATAWQKVALVSLMAAAAFVVITVPDHYLEQHVGRHLLRRHMPRVFAWTAGALVLLGGAQAMWDVGSIVRGHEFALVAIGALVGLVPDSGPQVIFPLLYAGGDLPLSVLVANMLVQDGHGLLPLLAASLRDSVRVKVINLVVGLMAGYLLLLAGV